MNGAEDDEPQPAMTGERYAARVDAYGQELRRQQRLRIVLNPVLCGLMFGALLALVVGIRVGSAFVIEFGIALAAVAGTLMGVAELYHHNRLKKIPKL